MQRIRARLKTDKEVEKDKDNCSNDIPGSGDQSLGLNID